MNKRFLQMKQKAGVILPFVLVVLCVLGVLVFSFSNYATQSQRAAFRFEQDDVARRTLESALDETFNLVQNETETHGSSLSPWLVNVGDATSVNFDLAKLSQTKALIDELNQDAAIKIGLVNVAVSKRRDDFRDRATFKGLTRLYYGNEGHGTLVLNGTITLMRGGKAMSSFKMERHHDYKVVCLVSDRKKPRNQAQNRCLDYVLYVRDGLTEFRDTAGRMLNNTSLKLEVKSSGRGRIYFGGTDDKNNYVFLNLSPEQAALVPPSEGTVKNLQKGDTDSMTGEIIGAEPQVDTALQGYITAESTKPDSTLPAGTSSNSLLSGVLSSMNLGLKSNHLPFSENPTGLEGYARESLFGPPGKDAKDNTEPGVKLLGSGEDPHQIIEGQVRSRFLNLVEVNQIDKLFEMIKKFNPSFQPPAFFLSFTVAAYEERCKRKGETPNSIFLGLYRFLEKLIPDPLRSSTTKADDGMPYGSKDDSEREKTLIPCALGSDFQAFGASLLRSYCALDMNELTKLGVVSGNQLKLRGVVLVQSPLTLGEGGTMNVSGEGVLSTLDNNIVLKAGIKSPPGTTCILWTKGTLVVDTSEPIEAGIIAHTIKVEPGKQLNIKGSVFVNRLGSAQWPPGPHVIEYDAGKFYKENDDLYSVTLSSRITFIRMSGED